MGDRQSANNGKCSDGLGAKLLYIFGILFVLLFLAALFTGEIDGGFGEVNNYDIDTVPP